MKVSKLRLDQRDGYDWGEIELLDLEIEFKSGKFRDRLYDYDFDFSFKDNLKFLLANHNIISSIG